MTQIQKKILKALKTKTLLEALEDAGKSQDWFDKQSEEFKTKATEPLEEPQEDSQVDPVIEKVEDNTAELNRLIGELWTGVSHDFAREAKFCLNRNMKTSVFLRAHQSKCAYISYLAPKVARVAELLDA